jgi:hypothetical protein
MRLLIVANYLPNVQDALEPVFRPVQSAHERGEALWNDPNRKVGSPSPAAYSALNVLPAAGNLLQMPSKFVEAGIGSAAQVLGVTPDMANPVNWALTAAKAPMDAGEAAMTAITGQRPSHLARTIAVRAMRTAGGQIGGDVGDWVNRRADEVDAAKDNPALQLKIVGAVMPALSPTADEPSRCVLCCECLRLIKRSKLFKKPRQRWITPTTPLRGA